MFEAYISVCAALLTGEVDTNNCLFFNDTWGPYKTQENCDIRSEQMVEEITTEQFLFYFFSNLNFPEQIAAKGFCKKTQEKDKKA